ncbi:allophanate hydrolase [Serinicoccus sp. CUA-874]|uniref:5-oxoprolinase subunit PxpB n=1 Tax=Serinicoccus sp. CUA-874 TaxID=1517939 RepID=UPI00095FE3CC|nr:5-oxoprolinase subunit PxpB [Serinicoccus sp. CUA-874]OLT15338.1 allophanate hydrolase [Serinicoccus sp. CUA-874]
MRCLPCGEAGLLVELDDLEQVLALHAALQEVSPPGVVDLVPAARTLLLQLDPALTDPGAVAEVVRSTTLQPGAAPEADSVEIAVVYDGADLAEVAEHTGMGPREVVRAHTGQEWRVAFCGFSPGFGYLVAQDDRLHVPRRSTPRTRVPAGAVGLAGEFGGIYPRESPGGWQLIGRTDATLWDVERDPPALLVPGTRVRFVEVEA